MKDENRFRELMTVLGEIHDRQITRLLLDVYWRILEPFPDEACIRAFHELIGRVKFFPKPAEFLELLEARQGDQATSAWLDVIAVLKRYGNYRSVRFADPVIHSAIEAMGGWVRLGLMEERERPWRQKEFERLYAILTGRGSSHPAYLAGIHEIENAGGYQAPEVIDVGVRGGIKDLAGRGGGDDRRHDDHECDSAGGKASGSHERPSLVHIASGAFNEAGRSTMIQIGEASSDR